MTHWIHQLLNPHCPHCAEERRESREVKKESTVCASCETYKEQLNIANHEKKVLLDKLLKEPERTEEVAPQIMTQPKTMPWRVRQQMLEAEDRAKAKLMREAPKPLPTVEVDSELEREVLSAETARENTKHG